MMPGDEPAGKCEASGHAGLGQGIARRAGRLRAQSAAAHHGPCGDGGLMLPSGWRRLVLLLHVTTSVGLLGAVAAFLALALAGNGGDAGAYGAMRLVTWQVIVPLAIAALVIGAVSSLTTPWGLVRYWWLAAKLAATVVAVGVLLLQTRTIDVL